MKKAFTLAATAALLLAGSITVYAQSHYYGFLTSCGYEEVIETSFELDDDFLATHLDNLEAEHCGN